MKEPKKIRIAIDGPAASGKSTTARLVAKKLGYLHIDTGSMYRAITLKALRETIDASDEQQIVALAQRCRVELEPSELGNRLFLDGKDSTNDIRLPRVTSMVSLVSSYQGVRDILVREQRRMSAAGGVVLEGRDIGTVVLPDAEVKIFMIADVGERARRRKKQLALAGIDADEKKLVRDIEERDKKDSTRHMSPLQKASDAIELDTSNLTIDEQVDFIFTKAQSIINRV
jgi:cytidylate kinase